MKRNKEIIEVNELSETTKVSMKTRIIAGLIALAIFMPLSIVGDWFFVALILFVGVVAIFEIIRCAKPKHVGWLTVASAVLMLAITFWPILRQLFDASQLSADWKLWTSFPTLYLSIIILFASLFMSFLFVVLDKDTSVSEACFIFTASLLVSFGLQCALFLRFYPIIVHYGYQTGDALPSVSYFNVYENLQSVLLLFFVIFMTFMTDIGAYFVGVFFGRHKINERISPKKTWEGFIGGMIISFVLSSSIGLILSACGIPLLPGVLDLNHWYYILGLALVTPLLATLGDFVFSSFKRTYDIKDFGNIIPGHGGILDRLDSLIFAFISAAIFICIVSGLESPLL